MIVQAEQMEEFEKTLLSYTAMCYSVALTLTRNPVDARYLTRDVLVETWQLNDYTHDMKNIKTRLLAMLRAKFKEDYCTPEPDPSKSEAPSHRR